MKLECWLLAVAEDNCCFFRFLASMISSSEDKVEEGRVAIVVASIAVAVASAAIAFFFKMVTMLAITLFLFL